MSSNDESTSIPTSQETVSVVRPDPLHTTDTEPIRTNTAVDTIPSGATQTSSVPNQASATSKLAQLGNVLVAGDPLQEPTATEPTVQFESGALVNTVRTSATILNPGTGGVDSSVTFEQAEVVSTAPAQQSITTASSPSTVSQRPSADTLGVESPATSSLEPTPTITNEISTTQASLPPSVPPSSPLTTTTERLPPSSSLLAVPVSEQHQTSVATHSLTIVPTTSTTRSVPSDSSTSPPTSTRSAPTAASSDLSLESTASSSTVTSSATSRSAGIPDHGGVMALDVGDDASSTSASSTSAVSSRVSSSISSTSAKSTSAKATVSVSSAGVGSDSSSDAGSGTATATGDATGTAAVDHAQANAESKSDDEGGKLNSIAIVGIVGGVLVALILLYLSWYQWRKKKAREALMEIPDDSDEKFAPAYHDRHITRSSFGAAEPITPYYHHRRRRTGDEESLGGDEYGDEWYEPQTGRARYDHHGQTEYVHEDPFDVPQTARPDAIDGRDDLDYDYDPDYDYHYGDGMTAALEDGMMTPALVPAPETGRSGHENPFVPPVPPVPSSHSASRHETVRAAPAVPDDVDPSYGMSIYDAYGPATGGASRSQTTEMMEPKTSNLLPWLNKGTPAPPPVPSLPGQEDLDETPPPHESVRAPPRAMMAQTPVVGAPVGHGGELGAAPIPAFR